MRTGESSSVGPVFNRSSSRSILQAAFSLVELIVVVVIIGILAAIAIPRFSQGAEQAGPKATQQDLAILQKQIEIYAIEHTGVYPAFNGDGTNPAHTEKAFLSQLTRYTDYQGVAAPARSARFRFGPYLRHAMPTLKCGPKAGRSGVLVVTGKTGLSHNESADVGWIYNDTSGEIAPNAPAEVVTGSEASPQFSGS